MATSSGPMVTVAATQPGSSCTATAAAPVAGERVPSAPRPAPHRTLAKCLQLLQLEHHRALPFHRNESELGLCQLASSLRKDHGSRGPDGGREGDGAGEERAPLRLGRAAAPARGEPVGEEVRASPSRLPAAEAPLPRIRPDERGLYSAIHPYPRPLSGRQPVRREAGQGFLGGGHEDGTAHRGGPGRASSPVS